MKSHGLEIIGATIAKSIIFEAGGATVTQFSSDANLGSSDSIVPTQAAIKTYVDAAVPGDGNLIFQGDSKVEVTDTGADGKVIMEADGTEVFSGTDNVQRLGLSAGESVEINQTNNTIVLTADNVTVIGDLAVDGTTFVVNNQEVTTSDNIIVVNHGEAGAGVTAGTAGIEIDRGQSTNYQFLFNEASDTFRIGEIGSLQAVATREDSPVDSSVPWWNDAQKRFDTTNSKFRQAGLGAELYHEAVKIVQTSSTGLIAQIATFEIETSASEPAITINANSSVDIFHDNEKVLSTYNVGADHGLTVFSGANEGNLAIDASTLFLWTATDSHLIEIGGTNAGTTYKKGLVNDPDAGIELYYDGSKVIETIATGLQAGVAAFDIKTSGGEDGITINNNGAVELFHNNIKVSETTAAGITGAVWG